ncbi:IclR family transcriptional regulator [Chachezhania antarctica]|uniref:IclR family transcriptional regulator n=1 Tax=Chachezhania antarctica TaxID=2340860 RepID=UPI000EAC078A|nr:IclR family transcriptional regulator [Chachezhania antarctica]
MTDGRTTLNQWADAGRCDLPRDTGTDQALSSTLIRGLEILALYSDSEISLSNSEIARRLGLNRATVSRLCKTLVHMGYLRRDPKGAFRLAPRILSLSYPVLAATRWRHRLVPPMRELAEMSGGNVTLAVMTDDQFVQIQNVGNPTSFPHVPESGVTGPLHRSASGRALLSLLEGQALFDKLAELRQKFPAEFESHAELTAASITRCRTEGFCTSYGDWRANIVAVSTPLGVTDDGLRVALSCGLPRFSAREEYVEKDLGPRMAEAAKAMRLMGPFVPGPAEPGRAAI